MNRRGYRRDQLALAGARVFARPADLTVRKRAQAGASTAGSDLARTSQLSGRWCSWLRPGDRSEEIPGEASQGMRLHATSTGPQRPDPRFHVFGGLEKLAFVSGVGAVAADQPRPLPVAAALPAGGGSLFSAPGRGRLPTWNSAMGTDPAGRRPGAKDVIDADN
jgi:hypothetical protein